MISINCESLSLSYGADTIIENVSFALNDGDKLGVIGVNGAGKSTLFSMITGVLTPSAGSVYIAKDKRIGILQQNVFYESNRTILEEAMSSFSELIDLERRLELLRQDAEKSGDEQSAKRYSDAHECFTSLGGYEFRGRCKGILKNLSLPEDIWSKTVSSLSGGQKTRLSLACLLLRDPDILLLDEPTNHLDTDAIFWLESYLKSSKKTVLVISHDRYFLDSVVGKVLEIENKRSRLYNGNYTAFVAQKAKEREIQERHYNNQQKEIKRIEAYIEQQRRWNRERNIIAAESRQKQLDKLERVDKPENLPQKIRMSFGSSGESGNDVLSVRALSKNYPSKKLFTNVSFEVKKNDRIFISGPNGCGKSTLIKILAGRLLPDAGGVVRGYNLKIGYYDQENQDLHSSNTVIEELWSGYPSLNETTIRNTLALFLFKGEDVFKSVSVLSGGEKARLTLAKLMLSKMNLLILDEPTNHLDINSREALEEALSNFEGTIIAVSHDRYFVNKLATGILDFNQDLSGSVYFYDGGYEQYLEYKRSHQINEYKERTDTRITRSKEDYINSKKDLAEARKVERRISKAKDEIANTEKRIAELNEEMSGEAAFDHIRLSEITAELSALEEKLLELYELLDEYGEI